MDLAERLAKSQADREAAELTVSADDILAVMDPNGATLKLAEIVGQLATRTGFSVYALGSNVQNKLRRMRKVGTVELTKGPGSGWRVTDAARRTADQGKG